MVFCMKVQPVQCRTYKSRIHDFSVHLLMCHPVWLHDQGYTTYIIKYYNNNNIILRINRLLETVWTLARLVHCMNTQNVHTMCNFARGQFHKYGNCMGICGGQSRKLLPTTTFLAVSDVTGKIQTQCL